LDLIEYVKHRDGLLERIRRVLEKDVRVRAAWLSGSFGRLEEDEWSDIDLHIAVEDGGLAGFLEEREKVYRSVGRPILVQNEMESDSQSGARFQLVFYPGPIEVDWNIGPVSRAETPSAFRMLVERDSVPAGSLAGLSREEQRAEANHWLTFFWAMAPIAVKFCGRSDTRRAVAQIDLLSTAFIALWRLVSSKVATAPNARTVNRVLEPELDAVLPRLGSTIAPGSALDVVKQLCARVEGLHSDLEAIGAEVPLKLIAEVSKMFALAEVAMSQTDRPPRPYR
jgi:predicted nucleotidyltransferase